MGAKQASTETTEDDPGWWTQFAKRCPEPVTARAMPTVDLPRRSLAGPRLHQVGVEAARPRTVRAHARLRRLPRLVLRRPGGEQAAARLHPRRAVQERLTYAIRWRETVLDALRTPYDLAMFA